MAQTVVDQGDGRKYWTQIPNIIFELGLSPHELSLYAHLKRTARPNGKCFKATRTLARETGMGIGTVSRTKIELEKPRSLLGGLPLIRTAKRRNPKGGREYDEITLTDLWPINSAHFSSSRGELDPEEQVPEGNASSSTVEQKKNRKEKDKKNREERDFIAELRADDFYSHIDFDLEIEKMRRWLARPENKGRILTERFMVRWLDKIDRPVTVNERPQTQRSRAEKEEELRKKMGWDKLERTA